MPKLQEALRAVRDQLTAQFEIDRIVVEGLSLSNTLFSSLSEQQPWFLTVNTFQWYDGITWSHGKHNLKFGFDPNDLKFHVECKKDNHDCPGKKVVKAEVISRVRGPVGLNIGSQTPAEIAPIVDRVGAGRCRRWSDVEDRRQTGTIWLPAGDVRADAGPRVLILACTAIVGQPAMLQQSSRRFTVAGRPVQWLSCLGDGQGGRSSGEFR
jgi:hypothetical protein